MEETAETGGFGEKGHTRTHKDENQQVQEVGEMQTKHVVNDLPYSETP